MTYQKPMVTIELAEYLTLTGKHELKGAGITEEEYRFCTTKLVIIALRTPELLNQFPKDGIVLNTPVGDFRAMISLNRMDRGTSEATFSFTRITNGS